MSATRRYIAESTDEPTVYSPSQLNRLIKETLAETFPEVVVEGEISNYKLHSSGHRYFALKDEGASVSATLWKGAGMHLKFEPENGMKVRVIGPIAVYEKAGSYQINVRKIIPMGQGELELAFRQLYARFEAEGLFAPERKRPLPPYARTIGVVTSPTGAAIRDIIHVAQRRNRAIRLFVFPAQVQGDGAEETVARGIEYFNSRNDIDLLIVGRGGGSMEDLWAFNSEIVVRAIVNSRIPVVTGIGHEVDWTLADYVADQRAPTPSAAAELATWEREVTRKSVEELARSLRSALGDIAVALRERLEVVTGRGIFANPNDLITQRQQSLDSAQTRFAMAARFSYGAAQNALSLAVGRLDSLSPLKTLARGYAVARRAGADGRFTQVVRLASDVRPGEALEIIVQHGRIVSEVKSIEN